LLLVPSVWEEGFGMVAVEAQSCGIPVIASARGGLPESVGDGGVLIDDYTDPSAWLRAIRGLLDDAGAYRALGEKALRHARAEEFSARVSSQRMLEVCSRRAPVSAGRCDACPATGSGKTSSALRALLRVFSR
jgi:glycosyltransferase involved in cell wall biosynthesis